MKTKIGYLEVIAGPMYCGKTEELIRQVKRATIGKKNVQAFNHIIDNRYSTEKKLFSHNGQSHDSEKVSSAQEILKALHKDTEIVAIDEAQWFGDELVPVVEALLEQGKKVIVAGLAMTFDRKPFIPIPTLMVMADRVTKLSAICSLCGEEAVFHKRVTKKKVASDSLAPDPAFVSKLDASVFQARCRKCWNT